MLLLYDFLNECIKQNTPPLHSQVAAEIITANYSPTPHH